MLTSTFTLLGRCARTGELGAAVASAIPAVGSICPFVSPWGAVATQSFNNYYFGIDGLRLLREGMPPREVAAALTAGDPQARLRQLLVLDAAGRSAAHTGEDCVPRFGHVAAADCIAGGNMLSSDGVLHEMVSAFARESGLDLCDRLMAALDAAQAAGGDLRGKQSAALKVFSPRSEVPVCDLRVDEHEQPLHELRRVLGVARLQLMPFLRAMPTRDSPAGTLSPRLADYLSLSVDERRTTAPPA
jgi:uncharacterized Ntn-hydrolase superfamily protein